MFNRLLAGVTAVMIMRSLSVAGTSYAANEPMIGLTPAI